MPLQSIFFEKIAGSNNFEENTFEAVFNFLTFPFSVHEKMACLNSPEYFFACCEGVLNSQQHFVDPRKQCA